MRMIILALACLLSACAPNTAQKASERAQAFYTSYLTFLAGDSDEYSDPDLREYVSLDTISRIKKIQEIPEQELIEADYFTYVQDYDLSWIKALNVGEATPFLGGVIVPVQLGVEDGKTLDLQVFMRLEGGEWKIYRVRDVTDNFEHPIFDHGAISGARSEAGSDL